MGYSSCIVFDAMYRTEYALLWYAHTMIINAPSPIQLLTVSTHEVTYEDEHWAVESFDRVVDFVSLSKHNKAPGNN